MLRGGYYIYYLLDTLYGGRWCGGLVAVKCCPAVAVVEVCGGGAVGCGVIMELRQLKMELIFSCVY